MNSGEWYERKGKTDRFYFLIAPDYESKKTISSK